MATKIEVFRLEGTRPLLCHNPQSMIGQATGPKKVVKDPPDIMAEKSAYRDEKKRYVFPSRGIRACFMQGAKKSGLKAGKTALFTLLSSTFFPQEASCLILDAKTGKPFVSHEVYITTVVIGTSRIVSGRAMFKDWMIRIPVELDDSRMEKVDEWAEKILTLAGSIIGIGDDRIFNDQTRSCGEHGAFRAKIEK